MKLAYPKSDDFFGFIKKKSVLPKPVIVLRQCSCVSVSSLTKADWDLLLVTVSCSLHGGVYLMLKSYSGFNITSCTHSISPSTSGEQPKVQVD